jgi:drug/metabolite transporter (DMT)-like permease
MRGAALMSASMAGFALNDTALKYGGADLGLFQAIFIRGLFATAIMAFFAYLLGTFKHVPRARDLRLIGLRSVAEIGATLAFLTALFNLPLANLTAILQALPLSIALAAAIFFNEPLGHRRITAILIGFIGVLIIVRPGFAEFSAYSLLGLVAVAFVTLRDLTARQLSPSVASVLVAFVASIAITLTGAIGVVLTQTWRPPTSFEFGTLALAAVFLMIGYYCAVATMRIGDVAIVSSFRYTVMLWAITLGWLVFGDIPDLWTFLGICIILMAGLFTIWRERKLAKKTKH